ncbi:hypothetical protein GX50_02691 [[Emmonsia] crescens]|uniref:BTB domain-containing protein n=1 Tax=[Emmonsia] crescens TaxID=73230 RepID=A0A2B7ZMU9_9EURO|nr:hypothetical protein GX50_02691 [Emmonsia crescens]
MDDNRKGNRFFDSPSYSDVTLYLGPKKVKFHGHYVIFSARTSYFDKAKTGGFEEGQTNEFHLAKHKPNALYRMLQYIYTGDYYMETNPLLDGLDDPELLMHTQVYILADYFDIRGLKTTCLRKFVRDAPRLWKSDSLIDSIGNLYSTPKSSSQRMRNLILEVVMEHIEELHKKERFRNLLNEHAEFAADVVELLLKNFARK